MDLITYHCPGCDVNVEMFSGYVMECQSTPVFPSHAFKPIRATVTVYEDDE